MTGYDALRNRAAWLDLSGRGKIKVSGEDRARLLHAMTTNHIQQLTPRSGCYAFFLNDKGRILADANVLCRPDHFLLDVEPESRDKLYQHLDHYIIADDVTLEDQTESATTVAVEGPESAAVLERMGAPVPQANYGSAEWGDWLVARLNTTGSLGFFIFASAGPASELIGKLGAAGAVPADAEAARVVRLEHGKPRYGEDLTERFLAQEANQPYALHFNKGCYLGQEIVERVRSRGQIHRVLMPLLLDAQTPPEPGAKLHIGEANVAEITSATYSPALGRVAALAYVRTEHARPHTTMMLDGVQAEVAAPAGH
ncbi:MAG TPA: glycine cleavage T C-terminal barrel domain-containing protein [Bryobacteraceae bacterium]|nr:glycine cleavage T C-terminal barrel domain-containing protein [Bryobacteraceae bacterium]